MPASRNVESDDGDHEREAGEEERPPFALQNRRVRLCPVERHAPAHVRRVAEAEKLEARIDQQRDVEHQHERGRDAADHVRHDLAEDDARGRFAGHLGRLHEVTAAQGESLPAQDARLECPERQSEDEDHRRHAAGLQIRRDHDQQRDRRDDEEDVRREVDDVVDDPARVRGENAQGGSEDGCEDGRGEAEDERPTRAEDDLGEDVASLVGRAEEVIPRRRLPRGEHVEVGRVLDRDQRRDQSDDEDEGDEQQAEARLRVRQEDLEPTRQVQPSAARASVGRQRQRGGLGDGGLELGHLLGAHARIEGEVGEVHDEVGGDDAEREHEQEPLGQRVVVAERCLL